MIIGTPIDYATLKQVLNIFNHISFLNINGSEFDFEDNELNKEINLPKLEIIIVKKFSYLNLFSELPALKEIYV